MTSLSIETIFLKTMIWYFLYKPRGFEGWLSQAQRVMVNGDRSEEPIYFQTPATITEVEAPSSMIHHWTMAFLMETGIWSATDEGRGVLGMGPLGSILGLKAQVLGLKAQVFHKECKFSTFCGCRVRRCKESSRVSALSLCNLCWLYEIHPWSVDHGNV